MEGNYIGVDKTKLIIHIIKLLDDNKPKVSNAALGTLSVIALKCGIECLNDFVDGLLNKDSYDEICDRVEAKVLPTIN